MYVQMVKSIVCAFYSEDLNIQIISDLPLSNT